MSEQLSAEEREALAANVCSCHSRLAHIAKILAPAVAQIAEDRVTARLAAVEALAEKWEQIHLMIEPVLGEPPQGQVIAHAEQLRAALHPDPSEAGA